MSSPQEQQPQSLQQYQQAFRLQQQARDRSLESPDRSVLQKMAESAKQYGKDVITGKKLWEGIKQNDGAVDGWVAHGATELANMLLHGHPAPVYARTLGPADQQAEVEHQASVDVQLPPQMSLELYQRGMVHQQEVQKQQEIER